jgi:hypothetical protein
MNEKVYQTTEDECRKSISGVCPGCGKEVEPIETVDNAGRPTFWEGCTDCGLFCNGVTQQVHEISKKLVADHTCDGPWRSNFASEELYTYEFKGATRRISRVVERVIYLLKENHKYSEQTDTSATSRG